MNVLLQQMILEHEEAEREMAERANKVVQQSQRSARPLYHEWTIEERREAASNFDVAAHIKEAHEQNFEHSMKVITK